MLLRIGSYGIYKYLDYILGNSFWPVMITALVLSFGGGLWWEIYHYRYRNWDVYRAIRKDRAQEPVTKEEAKRLRAEQKWQRYQKRLKRKRS